MSITPAEKSILSQLIAAWREEQLSPEQAVRLNAMLRESAAARTLYLRHLYLCANLRWLHGEGGELPEPAADAAIAEAAIAADECAAELIPVGGSAPRAAVAPRAAIAPRRWTGAGAKFNRSLCLSIGATALLFVTYLAVITWGMLGKEARGLRLEARGEGKEDSSSRPAYISASDNAEWRRQPRAGSLAANAVSQPEVVQGETLELATGVVELQLDQGAKVVVEGPARWAVVDGNRVRLTEGKLLANVPEQAIGFTVETPTSKIVDLGTVFGVEVNEQAGTQTRVFKGEVQLQPVASSAAGAKRTLPRRLTAGQSAQVDAQGRMSPVGLETAHVEQFIRSPRSPEAVTAPSLGGLEPPSAYSRAVLNTPGLVGYWRLGEDGSQGPRDEVGAGPSRPLGRSSGLLARFRREDYRRPGALTGGDNHALHFNGESYLEMADQPSLEGDWEGLTLAAWIKPDLWQAHSPDSSALIVGKWAHDANGSAYGLFYRYDGKLALAIGNGERTDDRLVGVGNVPIGYDTCRFVVGTWDKATGDCRLYVDGQSDQAQYRQPAPIKLNPNPYMPLVIGGQRSDNSRYFTGLIDEVSIFNRVLIADEIERLYRLATAKTKS